jgi:hypothetical protein
MIETKKNIIHDNTILSQDFKCICLKSSNGTGQIMHLLHFMMRTLGLFSALLFSKVYHKKTINDLNTNSNYVHSHLMSAALAKPHLIFPSLLQR